MTKRCVIIGSGLGGLSTGLILAKNGYEVTVLEQGTQPGGCLQCFYRHGAKFETGMHFIGSAEPEQVLGRLLQYLDVLPHLTLSRLDTAGYDVVSLDHQKFKFANGREAFVEQMSSYFPQEKDALVRYYDLVRSVADASSIHSLENLKTNAVINTEYQTRSVNSVIDELTNDKMLREVLVGNLPLYAGQQNKTPFASHAFIMDFYNRSAFRIVGGSDVVARRLVSNIEQYGGRVLTQHKVTRIVCDDTHATGVEVGEDLFIPADLVISDAHPSTTLKLVESKMIRPAFRERITNIPNTTGCFTLYLRFKKDSMPYMNHNFYSYAKSPWNCEKYENHSWPKGYLYMHFCHENQPTFADSGVVISYMTMSDVTPWANTQVGQRGEAYETYMKNRAEKLLDALETDYPGIRTTIESYYTSSPLTYRDYTGTVDGSMYGVAKNVASGPECRVPYKTKIPNLYFAGQNINSHGILGVLVGSIVVCSDILGAEMLHNQIQEACR